MDELMTVFKRFEKYAEQLGYFPDELILKCKLDGSGSLWSTDGDWLHYYKMGTDKSTFAQWDTPEEGVAVLKDVLATLAVNPEAVVWY